MNLSTGNKILRGRCTAVPLPSIVKEHVEELALEKGISSIKFTNKKGIELPNVDDVFVLPFEMVGIYVYEGIQKSETFFFSKNIVNCKAVIVDKFIIEAPFNWLNS